MDPVPIDPTPGTWVTTAMADVALLPIELVNVSVKRVRSKKRKHRLRKKRRMKMFILSWFEEFIVTAAISMLTMLETKIKNPVELEALQAAVAFLQSLLGGKVALKG